MHSFFLEPSDISDDIACLKGAEASHIYKVLRLTSGQKIKLFDGTGMIHIAEIYEVAKGRVQAKIIKSEQRLSKPPFLHVGQAMIKKKKMDLVIQKTTELGIESFHPFVSQYCSLTYRHDSQKQRWESIAKEACKQCERPTLPTINAVTDFDSLINGSVSYDQKLILWEKEQANSLPCFSSDTPVKSVLILIGPEGGFSKDEITRAKSAGFTSVTLGQRILRAETATIAVTAITQYLLDNMSGSLT